MKKSQFIIYSVAKNNVLNICTNKPYTVYKTSTKGKIRRKAYGLRTGKRHEMKTPHVKTSVVETFQFKFIVRVLSAIVWQVGARPWTLLSVSVKGGRGCCPYPTCLPASTLCEQKQLVDDGRHRSRRAIAARISVFSVESLHGAWQPPGNKWQRFRYVFYVFKNRLLPKLAS